MGNLHFTVTSISSWAFLHVLKTQASHRKNETLMAPNTPENTMDVENNTSFDFVVMFSKLLGS